MGEPRVPVQISKFKWMEKLWGCSLNKGRKMQGELQSRGTRGRKERLRQQHADLERPRKSRSLGGRFPEGSLEEVGFERSVL